MKLTLRILLLLLVPVFSTCKKELGPEDCFMAAGKESSLEVNPGSFYEITAGNRLVLQIKQDTTRPAGVIIKGGSNVIQNVQVEVNNGKLTIKDRNICNWTRDFSKKIHVEINCHTLHGLNINDACEIETTDTLVSDSLVLNQKSTGRLNLTLNIGKLEVNHEGAGEVDLQGYAAIFVPVMFDAGKLDARNLTGDYTFTYHYGINDLHVKPYKVLFIFTGNTGNTYYYADPFEQPLKITTVGSGKAERK